MHPKEALKKFLKSIGADTRSALVGYIVAVLIVAGGGLSALYKTSREWVLQILTTPTPLWATISLVLLGYLYIYLKFHKSYSSALLSRKIDNAQMAPAAASDKSKTQFFTFGNYKWKADIYPSGYFKVAPFPFCAKHDLEFIIKGSGMSCPAKDCDNTLSKYDDYEVKATAKSHIEKELRNNPDPAPKPQLTPSKKRSWVRDW